MDPIKKPTLVELGNAVISIREAVEMMTISGSKNAQAVLYVVTHCNDIVSAINVALKDAEPGEVDLDLKINLVDEEEPVE